MIWFASVDGMFFLLPSHHDSHCHVSVTVSVSVFLSLSLYPLLSFFMSLAFHFFFSLAFLFSIRDSYFSHLLSSLCARISSHSISKLQDPLPYLCCSQFSSSLSRTHPCHPQKFCFSRLFLVHGDSMNLGLVLGFDLVRGGLSLAAVSAGRSCWLTKIMIAFLGCSSPLPLLSTLYSPLSTLHPQGSSGNPSCYECVSLSCSSTQLGEDSSGIIEEEVQIFEFYWDNPNGVDFASFYRDSHCRRCGNLGSNMNL